MPNTEGFPQVEVKRNLVIAPDTLSALLQKKEDEVVAQFKSVEGRKALLQSLKAQEPEIQKIVGDDFSSEQVADQLEESGRQLQAEKKLFEMKNSPKEKGMFSKALTSIRQFPAKHPLITSAILIAALSAGAVYMGLIPMDTLTAWWNRIRDFFTSGGKGFGLGGAGGTAAGAAEGAAEATGAIADAAPAIAEGASGAVSSASELLISAGDGSPIQYFKVLLKGGNLIELNGQDYTFEAFKNLFETLPKELIGSKDFYVEAQRYASTLPTNEIQFFDYLKSLNQQVLHVKELVD